MYLNPTKFVCIQYILRLYQYRYNIGIRADIYISVGLFIVVRLQYKLEDFKCDYGADFQDKLCYAVSNGFYVIANHPCR